MKHLTLAAALCVPLALLGGCDTARPKAAPAVACGNNLNISHVDLGASAPSIALEPGVGCVSEAGGTIKWKIAGNDYAFTNDGISGKSVLPPGVTLTRRLGSSADTYEVTFVIASGVELDWYYDIKLYAKSAPAAVFRCDPTIVNSSSSITREMLGRKQVFCQAVP